MIFLSYNSAVFQTSQTICFLLMRNSSKFYTHLLCSQIPIEQGLSIFIHFQDLCKLKVIIKWWWNWPLGSISSKFFAQLLPTKIPKAQKDCQVVIPSPSIEYPGTRIFERIFEQSSTRVIRSSIRVSVPT